MNFLTFKSFPFLSFEMLATLHSAEGRDEDYGVTAVYWMFLSMFITGVRSVLSSIKAEWFLMAFIRGSSTCIAVFCVLNTGATGVI
jgi:hypothetical protein